MEQEIWKPIKKYEELYEISNLGRVKSLFMGGKIMKLINHCTGYNVIGLTKNGKQTLFRFHRLVAEHFCDKPLGCNIVNHKNCIKKDNRAINLEWTTVSGNTLHSFANGLQEVRVGEKSNLSVLSELDVLKIREYYKTGKYRQKDLGSMYNVSRTCISFILNKVTWKHI